MPLNTLVFYTTRRGNSVVEDAIDALGDEDAAAVHAAIEASMLEFPEVASVTMKKLKGKVFELCLTLGRREVRVLFAAARGGVMLLLHVFVKKTTKTPRGELDLALARYEEMTA